MGLFDNQDTKEGISLFTQVTWLIALPVVAGAIIGRWLDDKYQTNPAFIIIGVAIGIALAVASIVKIVKKYTRKS